MFIRGDPNAVFKAVDSSSTTILSAIMPGNELPALSAMVSTATIFSTTTLKAMDDCLDWWESIGAIPVTPFEMECSSLFARSSLAFLTDLFVGQSFAKKFVRPDRIDYYQRHGAEYLDLVNKQGWGKYRSERIQRIFLEKLSSRDPFTRTTAVNWLNVADSLLVHDAVKAALNDTSPKVRMSAALRFEYFGLRDGRPYLLESLKAQNNTTFMVAIGALKKDAPPEALKRLEAMASGEGSGNIADRVQALNALQYRRFESAPIFLKALRASEPHIVDAGLSAFNVSGSSTVLHSKDYELIADIAARPSSTSLMRTNAFQIFYFATDPMLRQYLLSRFRDNPDQEIRNGLTFALINFGKKKDVGWLMTRLEDPLKQCRISADSALGKITGISLREGTNGLDQRISLRKEWWEKHKNDPEYRP